MKGDDSDYREYETQRVMTYSYVTVTMVTMVTFIAGHRVPQSPQTKSTTDTLLGSSKEIERVTERVERTCRHTERKSDRDK